MKEFDTIAAVATSLGEAGISIVRVSGVKALSIVATIFRGNKGKRLEDIKPYTMKYGHIVRYKSNEIIDEVIVSYMKSPKSFTAEDTIEINCHGGVVATNTVLNEVIISGARLAEPGEFTKRAFLNGRIDLSQAEAVIDIIRAKTELSMKSALMQAEGHISKEIKKLRHKILTIIAHIEATVDFPEEDLEDFTSEKVLVDLKEVEESIERLLATSNEGKILRDGLNVVIAGKPNVGKSSLLNALLMEKRAIVTEIPGTTRDVIEEYFNLDGIPLKISDTAGIRETQDIVEIIGMEKSKEKIEQSDLVILMLDFNQELDFEDRQIIEYVKNRKHLIIINKIDLDKKLDVHDLNILMEKNFIYLSTVTGSGLDELKSTIKNMFFIGTISATEIIVTNNRHKEALIRARESCVSALETLNLGLSIDLACIDVRSAWSYLGEVTGETMQEDIIDKIFSEFCIGK